jgi:hypothetical protein
MEQRNGQSRNKTLKTYKHPNIFKTITKATRLKFLLRGSKGSNTQLLSGLGATSWRSIREQELHEVLGEDVGGGSGERVHAVHLHPVVDADGDDIARGDGLEVDSVVRNDHAKGFLDPQVKGAAHALSDVPARGAEMTRHGALGLRLSFFNPLARLEGSGLQLLQLLLGKVLGRLYGLCLGRQVPKSCPQA